MEEDQRDADQLLRGAIALFLAGVAVSTSPFNPDWYLSTGSDVGKLIGILIFNSWWTLEHAKRDATKTIRNHVNRFIWRGVYFTGVAAILTLGSTEFQPLLYLFLFQAAVFTMTFNIAYNKARGHAWHYLGKTSAIDRMFRKIPLVYYLLMLSIAAISAIKTVILSIN